MAVIILILLNFQTDHQVWNFNSVILKEKSKEPPFRDRNTKTNKSSETVLNIRNSVDARSELIVKTPYTISHKRPEK